MGSGGGLTRPRSWRKITEDPGGCEFGEKDKSELVPCEKWGETQGLSENQSTSGSQLEERGSARSRNQGSVRCSYAWERRGKPSSLESFERKEERGWGGGRFDGLILKNGGVR